MDPILPITALVCFLLPGIIFKVTMEITVKKVFYKTYTHYKHEDSDTSLVSSKSLTTLAAVCGISVFINTFCALILYGIGWLPSPQTIFNLFISALLNNLQSCPAYHAKEIHNCLVFNAYQTVGYILIISVASFCSGIALGILFFDMFINVITKGFVRKYKNWASILLYGKRNLVSYENSSKEDTYIFTIVSAMVEFCDFYYLYRGVVSDFSINEDGDLETITLTGASRSLIKDGKRQELNCMPKETEKLFLQFSNIKNFTIEYTDAYDASGDISVLLDIADKNISTQVNILDSSWRQYDPKWMSYVPPI